MRENYISVTPVRTVYAALDGGHIAPFASWNTAATNIQDAIDEAVDGDVVLVSNGTWYVDETLSIKKSIMLHSLNGPHRTMIDGNDAVRCIWTTNAGSVIEGFTVQNGNDFYDTHFFGGAGIYCERSAVRRCIIRNNWSRGNGGGLIIYSSHSTIENCMIHGNYAIEAGGGVYFSSGTMRNCTVVGNDANYCGGIYASSFLGKTTDKTENTIIYYNTSRGKRLNYDILNCYNCCSWPKPPGPGCTDLPPGVTGLDNYYLVPGSACIDAGNSSYVDGTVDIDGNPRINGSAVDIGCREFMADSCKESLTVSITADYTFVSVGFPVRFNAFVQGIPCGSRWNFNDGTILSNIPAQFYTFSAPGTYPVVYTVWNTDSSVSDTVTVHVAAVTNYVSKTGLDTLPYTSWATAAHVLQDAVDAAPAGGVVLAGPGVYDQGMRVAVLHEERTTNRVVLSKSISLIATNAAPFATLIRGVGKKYNAAIRCVFMESGCLLNGFTITNGSTRIVDKGGGVYNHGGIVSDCTIAYNIGLDSGGGCYSDWDGLVTRCAIYGNEGQTGGGAAGGILRNSLITGNSANNGGGASYALVWNCVITNNSATEGGGIVGCEPYSSLIAGNAGGGAYYRYYGLMENCTVVDNSDYGVKLDTMAYFWYLTCIVNNCVIQYNGTNNWIHVGDGKTWYEQCCITPLPPVGRNNLTNDPGCIDHQAGNFRLAPSSPCIDRGIMQSWMYPATDLDGRPRVIGDSVDIGAYEYAPAFWCSFYAVPAVAVPDEEVMFVSAISEPDPAAVYYWWDFQNDGTWDAQGPGNDQPVWQYPAEGTYSVALMISNHSSLVTSSVRRDYIRVIPEPGSMAVLAGLIGLYALHRRKRATQPGL